jgi:hypothetical protein
LGGFLAVSVRLTIGEVLLRVAQLLEINRIAVEGDRPAGNQIRKKTTKGRASVRAKKKRWVADACDHRQCYLTVTRNMSPEALECIEVHQNGHVKYIG